MARKESNLTTAKDSVETFVQKRGDNSVTKNEGSPKREHKHRLKKSAAGLLALAFLSLYGYVAASRTSADPAAWDKARIAECESEKDIEQAICYGDAFTERLIHLISEGKLHGKLFLNVSIKKGDEVIYVADPRLIDLSVPNPDITLLEQTERALEGIDTKESHSIFLYALYLPSYTYGKDDIYSESNAVGYSSEFGEESEQLIFVSYAAYCALQETLYNRAYAFNYVIRAQNLDFTREGATFNITTKYTEIPVYRQVGAGGRKSASELMDCIKKSTDFVSDDVVTSILEASRN